MLFFKCHWYQQSWVGSKMSSANLKIYFIANFSLLLAVAVRSDGHVAVKTETRSLQSYAMQFIAMQSYAMWGDGYAMQCTRIQGDGFARHCSAVQDKLINMQQWCKILHVSVPVKLRKVKFSSLAEVSSSELGWPGLTWVDFGLRSWQGAKSCHCGWSSHMSSPELLQLGRAQVSRGDLVWLQLTWVDPSWLQLTSTDLGVRAWRAVTVTHHHTWAHLS